MSQAALTPQEYRALLSRAKRNKYRAVPVIVDGVWFASKIEAKRWAELQHLQRAGLISELGRQRRFALIVDGIHICDYVADFVYVDRAGRIHVEDAKGVRLAEYRIKKALMLACYRIAIEEIGTQRAEKQRRTRGAKL